MRFLIKLLESTQVELHGRYSEKRVRDLAKYAQNTSRLRAITISLLTPLPCLVGTMAIDLLPLRDPSEGVQANKTFFIRQFYNYLLVTSIAIHQIRIGVPALPYTTMSVIRDTVVVSILCLGLLYSLTLAIGFPLPFTILTMMPVWAALNSTCMAIQWMDKIQHTPEAREMLSNMFKLWTYEILMVFIYPPYFYVFTTLSGMVQTMFSLFLPLIKVFVRNLFARAVTHLGDEVPEIVIFNADLFSSLFVSYCMQSSPSIWTTMVLMAADIMLIGLSLRDIENARTGLEDLERQVNDECVGDTRNITACAPEKIHNALGRANILIHKEAHRDVTSAIAGPQILHLHGKLAEDRTPQSTADTSVVLSNEDTSSSALALYPLRTTKKFWGTGSVHPIAKVVEQRLQYVSAKLRYTGKVRRLLYMAEFLLLLNYIEVVIPLVFSIYLFVTYQLPNHEYYAVFNNMDQKLLIQTLKNVMFYCFLEFLSLLLLMFMLQRMLGHSPIRQISFVLEKQFDYVQMSFVFWLFYNAQASLQHTGFDYTFQFAWLSKQSTSTGTQTQ